MNSRHRDYLKWREWTGLSTRCKVSCSQSVYQFEEKISEKVDTCWPFQEAFSYDLTSVILHFAGMQCSHKYCAQVFKNNIVIFLRSFFV